MCFAAERGFRVGGGRVNVYSTRRGWVGRTEQEREEGERRSGSTKHGGRCGGEF